MTAKRSFYQKSCGIAVIFCALCLFFVVGTETNFLGKFFGKFFGKSFAERIGKNEIVYYNDSFEQQLRERSQKYLDSIRNRTADLSPELQEKFKRQAQNTINKGLTKLNRSAELVQKRANSADLPVLSEAVQKIGKISGLNVLVFLSRNFYCPTELEVTVRVALPYWNLFRYAILTAGHSKTLFGMFSLDLASCNAIVVPVSPRDLKTLIRILGQLSVSVSLIDAESVIHRLADDELLTGFTLIAQTVVRRE
ncbi:MAG: hypothetical protein LBQ50_09245 [Planctomycetaceae bacterium]|jgi:hypothetical protein|nr:hypothetical protein [Planctomycetaceae bacterium]